MATFLVTDAGLGSAVSVIRSLAAAGHAVVAVDDHPFSAGLRSRHTTHARVIADPARHGDAYARTIVRLVGEHGVDAVIPITDASLIPLVERRDDLGAALGVAATAALAETRDKAATVDRARSLGVPVPDTVVVGDVAQARRVASDLGWPVVVKPRWSRVEHDGRIHALEVTYANDHLELERRLAALLPHAEVLLQRYHGGAGIGVELLLDGGRPLAAFQHRRIREVPVTGGASAYRESVELDDGLLHHSVRLLAALEWTGLAMVEFRVAGDEARLLEINGRIWGSLPLAVKSGMDFPALYGELLLGRLRPTGAMRRDYRTGVRSRNLGLELVWIASVLRGKRHYPYLPMPKRSAGLAALGGLIIPSAEHDILSRDDPLPGLVDLVAAVRHVTMKGLGHG